MVTPSFVMVGEPYFLSRTTLRPRGPSVTLTVFARASTPASSLRRASSSNSRILGMDQLSLPNGEGAPDGFAARCEPLWPEAPSLTWLDTQRVTSGRRRARPGRRE